MQTIQKESVADLAQTVHQTVYSELNDIEEKWVIYSNFPLCLGNYPFDSKGGLYSSAAYFPKHDQGSHPGQTSLIICIDYFCLSVTWLTSWKAGSRPWPHMGSPVAINRSAMAWVLWLLVVSVCSCSSRTSRDIERQTVSVPPVDLDKIYAFFTDDQTGYSFLTGIGSQVRSCRISHQIIVTPQLVFNTVGYLGGHLIWQVMKVQILITETNDTLNMIPPDS